MKRTGLNLQELMQWPALMAAFYRAASAKRHRPEVAHFADNLQCELERLQTSVLQGCYQPAAMQRFTIRDPKQRVIHAPAFVDRVLHHALMAGVAPVLDKALVPDCFACRQGRGTLAAVQRAQQHMRRYPVFVKTDVAAFFANIEHQRLLALLQRHFKNPELLALLQRIVTAHHHSPDKGLAIGALTSQHFANSYLAGFDRLLLEQLKVPAMVRYMDDTVWWCRSVQEAKSTLASAQQWLQQQRGMQFKSDVQINHSRHGLRFCGYRILPQQLGLGLRMKRSFASNRAKWEGAWLRGDIDSAQLQAGLSATLAAVQHADSNSWRREQLLRRPPHPDLQHA